MNTRNSFYKIYITHCILPFLKLSLKLLDVSELSSVRFFHSDFLILHLFSFLFMNFVVSGKHNIQIVRIKKIKTTKRNFLLEKNSSNIIN